MKNWLIQKLTASLTKDRPKHRTPLCDFDRLCYEVRPGDVILVEGTSRVSDVIKLITQSTWTHSALYIGRLYDIDDEQLRARVQQFYKGDPNDQLIIEALLGEGTIIGAISKYRRDHLRICRPKGLAPADVPKVLGNSIMQLGKDYDIRHLFDLARFLFPWTILPRRWRSSLFEHSVGHTTRTVCSCLIAESFHRVQFPILPFVGHDEDGELHIVRRNPRLYTPKDFDYSPYFDIIKYPYLGLEDLGMYRRLPWSDEVVYNDEPGVPVSAVNASGDNKNPQDASIGIKEVPARES